MTGFPDLRFKGTLRPAQAEVLGIAKRKLAGGARRLHIVAPPGSGKTILGLYLWAECLKRPAAVFSPNSAIQSQWASKLSLFEGGGAVASTDPKAPGLLTSLTYQSVTLPGGGEDLDREAVDAWVSRLLEKGQAATPEEAEVWIRDLRERNPAYHDERLSAYRKEVRDRRALKGDALGVLHASARDTFERLRKADVGVLILDECHHLMGHWGRVLAEVETRFRDLAIVGLTATPPERDGRLEEDLRRYDAFFGPVDYEVPVPAVVKDGFLSPYQDLVHFVRPTDRELAFVANADKAFRGLLEVLPGLPGWLEGVLRERRLPTGAVKDWEGFRKRDPGLADAGRLHLLALKRPLPEGVPGPDRDFGTDPTEVAVTVLDRYVRHALRRSGAPEDLALADRAVKVLRMLGVQVTETGTQACASPVGRVLACSQAKAAALLPILKAERAALGERIRAVVVTDFEKTSALSPEVAGVLDAEAGGAAAAFRVLLSDPGTDALDPVLLTGSTLLVDDDLADRLKTEAEAWIRAKGADARVALAPEAGFSRLEGSGPDWSPQLYVGMVTEFFQRGLTRCLVGTRGLLGEGWDATKVNVLVDLTSVTTSMSVNQLRGRSFRIDADDPEKLADNWDVVCVAPEFSKGLDDYRRFLAKHRVLFGVTEDGAVEKGAGHVHPAFTEIRPEGVEDAMNDLNAAMLARPARRQEARLLWRIGEPFRGEPVRALEVRPGGGGGGGFPPFAGMREPWTEQSLALRVADAVLGAMREAGLVRSPGGLRGGAREGGYLRVMLEKADPEDAKRFLQALREALGPLDRPRYAIPRFVDEMHDTFLSKLLPKRFSPMFQGRRRRLAMLHAVPSELAKNKELAAVYERHWNRSVSPGAALYALQGEGSRVLEEAQRAGQVPRGDFHDKEVFL